MRRQRQARKGQEKRENRRPILRKLCAALLKPFKEQHSKKVKGSVQGNWDPREVQQPFRPNPNGIGDRTTTLRRLLIGAVYNILLEKTTNMRVFVMLKTFSICGTSCIYYYMARDLAAGPINSRLKVMMWSTSPFGLSQNGC